MGEKPKRRKKSGRRKRFKSITWHNPIEGFEFKLRFSPLDPAAIWFHELNPDMYVHEEISFQLDLLFEGGVSPDGRVTVTRSDTEISTITVDGMEYQVSPLVVLEFMLEAADAAPPSGAMRILNGLGSHTYFDVVNRDTAQGANWLLKAGLIRQVGFNVYPQPPTAYYCLTSEGFKTVAKIQEMAARRDGRRTE